MHDDSLPGPAATGCGTVIVEPTLYWSGSGDWTTGQWELANGTPTPWIDGSSVYLAAGSEISVSGSVNVGSITVAGNATIEGGTLTLPAWGGTITVLSGTATIDSTLAGAAAAAWRRPARARSCSMARWPTPARRRWPGARWTSCRPWPPPR